MESSHLSYRVDRIFLLGLPLVHTLQRMRHDGQAANEASLQHGGSSSGIDNPHLALAPVALAPKTGRKPRSIAPIYILRNRRVALVSMLLTGLSTLEARTVEGPLEPLVRIRSETSQMTATPPGRPCRLKCPCPNGGEQLRCGSLGKRSRRRRARSVAPTCPFRPNTAQLRT